MSEVIPFQGSDGEPERGIVPTPTLQALHSLMSQVQRNPKFGMLVVIGPPGVGKTTALRSFQKGRPAFYCRMAAAYDSPTKGLLHIGRSLGIELWDGQSNRMLDQLAAQMRARAEFCEPGRRPILMIDEAQEMSDRLLGNVRSLWDICNEEDEDKPGYALVLCGNATFPERFSKQRFEQLRDRVFKVQMIKAPDIRDLEAICRHFGIDDARAIKLLDRQALTGSLRRVVRIIRTARLDLGLKKPLDAQAIASTIELLGYAKGSA